MSAFTSTELSAVARAIPQATPAIAVSPLRECLTFRIATEEYGIDILHVQEIRSYEAPLRFAGAPAAVSGVLHLRGVIVPIVDMRSYLHAADAGHDSATVIIVLNVSGRVVGAVVDSVSDVIALSAAQIKPPPQFNSGVLVNHLSGIASVPGLAGDRMLILVDIEALMSAPELGLATVA